jgi:nitrate reductase delta subunit
MTAPPIQTTNLLDPLADLLSYPCGPLHAQVERCLAALDPADAAAAALQRFEQQTDALSLTDLQEQYTAVFDMNPACTLDLGWHLFGETRDRGGFLAVLRADLERVGVPESIELPDHLFHVLALLGREEPGRAEVLAALVAPAVAAVHAALEERGSVYTDLLAAVDSLVARYGAGARREAVAP